MNTEGIGVLVGVDDSVCSHEALAWAAADAAALNVPLTVATVVDLPRLADIPLSADLVGAAQLAARRRRDAAVAHARDVMSGVRVEGRVCTGDAAAELLHLAAGAEEVVVGSHGAGRFGRLLIGSVSGRVTGHAPCPAVVVRDRRTDGPVVVGIDNSPHGDTALDYGFAYADRHGLPLVALHVFTLGALGYPVVPYPVPPYPITEELARVRADVIREAEHSLRKWTQKYPGVEVRVDVAEGRAAEQLVTASRSAGLLVVGTGGHGRLTGMLLGSVNLAVLRHAGGPVVIAR